MKTYKFLLFDADYTLLDFDADMLMAFEKLYTHFGFSELVPYAPAVLQTYEKHNSRWWKRFERGECSKDELFRGRFADFLAETRFPGDPTALNEMYFHFLGQGGVLYPGAKSMVSSLSKDFDLYIVTNGNGATAKTRVANAGLFPYIKDLFISETIGAAKPDIRYFNHVFSHIPDFDRGRAILIGDSPASDLLGAGTAGIDSLWYTPRGEDTSPHPYTYRASTYEEIIRIIRHA